MVGRQKERVGDKERERERKRKRKREREREREVCLRSCDMIAI